MIDRLTQLILFQDLSDQGKDQIDCREFGSWSVKPLSRKPRWPISKDPSGYSSWLFSKDPLKMGRLNSPGYDIDF